MALKLNIKDGESGVTTATQKGLQFANGVVIWGDPNNDNLVQVPPLNGGLSRGSYYLDRVGDESDVHSLARLNQDYSRLVAKTAGTILAPIDVEDYPRIVARSIMLAIGETEQL